MNHDHEAMNLPLITAFFFVSSVDAVTAPADPPRAAKHNLLRHN